MKSVRGLRVDLERLEASLVTVAGADEFASVALMHRGLSEVRDDLKERLDEARRARLDVVLNGIPVVGHEVRIDALSKLLHSLQESVSSVAQAMTSQATSSSSIPGLLREKTSLRLVSVYPGSFGAVLRGPPQTERDAEPLFEMENEVPTVLDLAVEAVLTIVDLANSEAVNDDPIIEAVLPLGSRAFKHLGDLSDAIVDEEMTASLSFVSPSAETHTSTLSKASAARLRDVLDRNRISERKVKYEGHLGTVSDIRNRIELQTEEGIIPAKVVDELVPELAAYYSHRVLASFDVTTAVSHLTGQERNSYVLTGLAMAPRQGGLAGEE